MATLFGAIPSRLCDIVSLRYPICDGVPNGQLYYKGYLLGNGFSTRQHPRGRLADDMFIEGLGMTSTSCMSVLNLTVFMRSNRKSNSMSLELGAQSAVTFSLINTWRNTRSVHRSVCCSQEPKRRLVRTVANLGTFARPDRFKPRGYVVTS